MTKDQKPGINKTGLQPVSRPVEQIHLDEQNWPGNFFYRVVLKGKLPTHSERFLFCSFLGDFFGVGGGGAIVDSRPVIHR